MPKWLDEDKANASLLDRDDVPQPVLDIIERAHAHIEELRGLLGDYLEFVVKPGLDAIERAVFTALVKCTLDRDKPPEVK